MKSLASVVVALLALQLLFGSPIFSGKPKVEVRVKVDDGIGKFPPQDSLSKSNLSVQGPLQSAEIFYFNVTVAFDNAEAVAQNKGQWCIKGDGLLGSLDYHATLSGNDLVIEVPDKNGKIHKMSFVIYDRKWRKLADI
jgi:hypothetical protein